MSRDWKRVLLFPDTRNNFQRVSKQRRIGLSHDGVKSFYNYGLIQDFTFCSKWAWIRVFRGENDLKQSDEIQTGWKSTGPVSNTYSTLIRTNAENTNGRPTHQYVWDDWNREMCDTFAIRSKLFRVRNNIGIGRSITLFRNCSDWTTTWDESRSQIASVHCAGQNTALLWENC